MSAKRPVAYFKKLQLGRWTTYCRFKFESLIQSQTIQEGFKFAIQI